MAKLESVAISDNELETYMLALARQGAAQKSALALAATEAKNAVLLGAAQELRAKTKDILAANKADVKLAKSKGHNEARLDRMSLDEARIHAIAQVLETVAKLPDPVGNSIAEWTRPNGLAVQRVRVPLGMIGVIYESRPNVTADAAALCFKSGNPVILRASSEIEHSAQLVHQCFLAPMVAAGFEPSCIQLVKTQNRAAVGYLLQGLGGQLDVVVPRGGYTLVKRVQEEARVPVFAHLEGVCHTYIDKAADMDMACAIVRNAKLRRTGICGATESVLIDKACAATYVPPIVDMLDKEGCKIWGDAPSRALDQRIKAGTPAHWAREYLAKEISLIQVDGVQGAIAHIAQYGSAHTDAIITADSEAAETFLTQVDSAIVMHNTSTQFADGGELGMGAEIGIATGRFHARGPVGLEQLTTMKYKIRGTGQTRP